MEQPSVCKKGTSTDGRRVPKIAVGDIEGNPRTPLEQVERLISAVSVETPKSCRTVLRPSSMSCVLFARCLPLPLLFILSD